MQLLYDFFPIVIFFTVYKFAGIYAATASAMAISLIQVIAHRIKHHKFENMQVVTLILIALLGSATLILHNPIFIKWKPSVLYWVFGIVFLMSHVIGKKPLIRRMLESKIQLPDIVWHKLNFSWVMFFVIVGFLNLYVIYHYSTNTWVNFKLFGVLGLTLIFAVLQAIYLSKVPGLNPQSSADPSLAKKPLLHREKIPTK